jgi:hypothetical protein
MSIDLGSKIPIYTHIKQLKLLKNMFRMQMKIFSMIPNASVLPELVFFGSPKHMSSVTL